MGKPQAVPKPPMRVTRRLQPDTYWRLRHHFAEVRALLMAVEVAKEKAARAQLETDVLMMQHGIDPSIVYEFKDELCGLQYDADPSAKAPAPLPTIPALGPSLPGLACLDDPPES